MHDALSVHEGESGDERAGSEASFESDEVVEADSETEGKFDPRDDAEDASPEGQGASSSHGP